MFTFLMYVNVNDLKNNSVSNFYPLRRFTAVWSDVSWDAMLTIAFYSQIVNHIYLQIV